MIGALIPSEFAGKSTASVQQCFWLCRRLFRTQITFGVRHAESRFSLLAATPARERRFD